MVCVILRETYSRDWDREVSALWPTLHAGRYNVVENVRTCSADFVVVHEEFAQVRESGSGEELIDLNIPVSGNTTHRNMFCST
jgi:hypothetical protein